MREKLDKCLIAALVVLSIVLAHTVDELKFKLEVAPIKYQIEECLNSEEAKAVERFNQNVRDAIDERRIQEESVCGD